jgi:hypothetical protein
VKETISSINGTGKTGHPCAEEGNQIIIEHQMQKKL